MRATNLLGAKGALDTVEDWVARAFAEINEASMEQPAEHSADAFTLTDFDEINDIRTEMIMGITTHEELCQIVATLIHYIQKRGPDKTQ